MGRYINFHAVVSRYPEASKIADSSDMGDHWISQAEYEIDAYLARRYTVPFAAPIPMVVQDLATDLAYFKMTARTKQSQLLKDYIDQRIAALVDGDMLLTTSDGVVSSPGDAAGSNTLEAVTSFGVDDPVLWSPDDTGVNTDRDEP